MEGIKTSLQEGLKQLDDAMEVSVNLPIIKREKKLDSLGRASASGKRKTAVARVWIRQGSGRVIINKKRSLEEYFRSDGRIEDVFAPFKIIQSEKKFDVWCTLKGGGLSAQSGALRHGISRALVDFNPDFHLELRNAGFLSRDPRMVERKKPGLKKARAKRQRSKR
jgi:small subunit ribosomal protein S9